MFDRRSLNLSHRLYDEALACRMRPFADGVQGFPRMVRDVAQLARQAGEARDRRRGHAGGPRHSREARCAARPSAAQRRRPRHRDARRARAPPASRPKASSVWRRATAPACCRSSSPTTAAASISSKLREAVVARNLIDAEAARDAERSRAAGVPVPARLHDEGDGHRDFRPRRRPRRRAGHGQAGARHGARLVAARQRHALPAAAAGDALGHPHAARRDRRRAVRLPARLTSSGRSSCRRTRSSCSKAASISTSTDGASGSSPRTRCSGVGEPDAAGDELPVIVLGDASHTYGLVVDGFSASASWSCSRSTRSSARSRTSPPGR